MTLHSSCASKVDVRAAQRPDDHAPTRTIQLRHRATGRHRCREKGPRTSANLLREFVTARHHSTKWRARMPACGPASASPWWQSSPPRQVSERAFRPAEHRFNRESQCRRSAPTTSAQTPSLSSPAAWPRGASPSARAAGRRRVRMAAAAGSSHSIRVLSGSPPTISPARRHGAAWRSRPRLSRQPCPQTSLRKQQSSPLHPMSCSSAPTGGVPGVAPELRADSGWAGCLARRWRFATRAPRRVGSRIGAFSSGPRTEG
jgi:hypothetical protein